MYDLRLMIYDLTANALRPENAGRIGPGRRLRLENHQS